MRMIKKLFKAYYRLFFFFFRIEKKNSQGYEETDKSATFMALAPLCLICFIDLLSVLYLVSRFIVPIPRPSNFLYVILAIFSIGFNFILFYHKRRYLTIIEMYKDENDDQRYRRAFWCIVFSLASLFSIGILIGVFGLAWK